MKFFVYAFTSGLFAAACLPAMSADTSQAMRCEQGITMLDHDKCNPTTEQQRKGLETVAPATLAAVVRTSISSMRAECQDPTSLERLTHLEQTCLADLDRKGNAQPSIVGSGH